MICICYKEAIRKSPMSLSSAITFFIVTVIDNNILRKLHNRSCCTHLIDSVLSLACDSFPSAKPKTLNLEVYRDKIITSYIITLICLPSTSRPLLNSDSDRCCRRSQEYFVQFQTRVAVNPYSTVWRLT